MTPLLQTRHLLRTKKNREITTVKSIKEKSRKKTRQVRVNWSRQLTHKQVPKSESGVRKGERSLLACHTCCKCYIGTTPNTVKVKLGIKVMKFVNSLIGWVVTVTGDLKFVRGRLHITKVQRLIASEGAKKKDLDDITVILKYF